MILGKGVAEYPSLETTRLQLRILTLQDVEEVFGHFSDEAVTRFMDIEPCKNLELATIDATVEPENVRSIHLLGKLGFDRAEELRDGLVCFQLHRPSIRES